MNQPTDNFNSINNQEQAASQFVGEQFIEWLMDYVGAEVGSWPELKSLGVLKPKIEKIRKFMLQRFLAAEAFLGGRDGDPGFLGFAIGNLSESDDPLAEGALSILEKKRQEEIGGPRGSGGKIFHRASWIKLLTALGITEEELHRAEPKEVTRNYISELSDIYSNSEWPTAMGAFAAHERSIPEEYTAIAAMLKANTQLPSAGMEILNWHIGLDYKYVVNTAHVLDKIVFDKENKDLVLDGVKRQLSTRKDFYSGLLKYLES
ncbi:MAG TPA: iron-containing redox enzyme family protein [Patescibacteria group bacterium]|nr:iron-containing redox enzyme family protein [Patescibacteria group bacterium]